MAQKTDREAGQVQIWDLPTRIFHWALVAFVGGCFVTAKLGGNLMVYHIYSGLMVLGLLLFRMVWGVVGSRTARFSHFVRGPRAAWQYARSLTGSHPQHVLGHNPLGGWSIVAMLLALVIQATTGLFANDEIFTYGPLYSMVSEATSIRLTEIHRLNQGVIAGLVGLHLLAVLFYLGVKRENLIMPMINGRKPGSPSPKTELKTPPLWVALLVLAFAAASVYFIGW
ncbi:cytochrome b/b6 domain-containing protein [Desulfosarcina ovata]|uniref:Cytochrome b561 n=2 Tax=Desulfosarcina ovata TaxID=83564 RepID=A0A5K8AEY1_9BACT|nr:cytochrome b/b6 domain-containing protein [Desulfosarcina ovata]BBO84040.1 cytochrome b561 [Desulfosarcina ovata subsp. sediminis]BBO90514.1 cytochrome b561 [Desulfosarcina ovata subsp. ovata]